MLAITFGVAVVMAVAGPYINTLEVQKKWQLLCTLVSLGSGMAIATLHTVRKRYHNGQSCGVLLLPLTKKRKNSRKKWLRWFWLLAGLPFVVLLNFELYGPKDNSVLAQISSIYMPLYYGFLFGKCGLALWTEGYEINGIELCENGILYANKFYAWKSPALRDMYWGQREGKIVININRAFITHSVPREQREAVDAILENYYRPQRRHVP